VNAARGVRNVAASIRQRLLDLTRAKGGNFQDCLDRYAVERLIYRLSLSDARERFLLKGALLFTVWFDVPHRPTRDADFLGLGEPDAGQLAETVRALCNVVADDGLVYDADSVRVVEIREQANYSGLRVTLRATLDNARCNLQLDVGFGDAVTPAPVEIEYPTLLDDLPRPRLRVYPRETVFAEKLEAMQVLGMANTRMKDYFDLLTLEREGAMDPKALSDAIRATFRRRGTALPEDLPLGLSDEFADDAAKRRQWDAFVQRNRLQAPPLSDVAGELGEFVRGLLDRARGSGTKET
jgi:predicted nucleotidyltransferase component of viral defense system